MFSSLLTSAAAVTRAISGVESASLHHDWLRTRLHEYDHHVQIDFLIGAFTPAALYYKAQNIRTFIRQQVVDMLGKVCGSVSVAGKELRIDLQLAGRPLDDGLLLKMAYAYEQAPPCHTRRPPI